MNLILVANRFKKQLKKTLRKFGPTMDKRLLLLSRNTLVYSARCMPQSRAGSICAKFLKKVLKTDKLIQKVMKTRKQIVWVQNRWLRHHVSM